MANSAIVLTQLDFDSNKESLKNYLKQQTAFKDYDFEGSNMSSLLDILSYNTYLNSFYLNMIANEMFLDSAQLRDSVISHSKELNYLPRSFTSSVAKININIISEDPARRTIVVPKGSVFLSRVGDDTFSFTTNENIVSSSTDGEFNINNVSIYEGTYLSDSYTVDYNKPLVYKINNNTVDISSVTVTVIEDNGSTYLTYLKATSLLDKDELSKIFFIQPSTNGSYEIVFGDGVIGRKPKNNSVVLIEYRICSGELPNGAQKFIASGRIDGESNVKITTVTKAAFGAVAESVESIKYNAPRAFTTQERAVTSEDYENLLRSNFAEINAVTAFGGEDANPPRYGKIFISVDLKDIDDLPNAKKDEYTKFLRSRSSVAMEPIFISPDYIYLRIDSNVKYNINKTSLNSEDIKSIVISSIVDYSNNQLNNFNRTLRYSRLINDIDNSDSSIVSNDTEIQLIKYLTPKLNSPEKIKIEFKSALDNTSPLVDDEHPSIDKHVISSTSFTYAGQKNCYLEDDGDGKIRIVTTSGSTHKVIVDVGTIDYDTGLMLINNFNISSFNGLNFKVYARTRNKDISSKQNVILNALDSDINLTIEQIRE